ncbi:hypothetical protein Tco_0393545 [Tanacetum coccineum]
MWRRTNVQGYIRANHRVASRRHCRTPSFVIESEDFDVDKAQEETKKKSKQDSPKTPPGSPPSPPPPPPPPSGASGASGTTGASDSAQAPPPPPPSSSTHQINNKVRSGDEVGRDHIPTVNLRQSWWKPLTEDRPATPEPAWTIPSSDLTMPTNNWASALKSTYAPPQENSLLAQTGDMAIFMDWYCKRQGITHLTLQDLEGPAFEIVKVFHPDVIHLQFQMEECHKLLTDQVDDTILRYNVSKPLPLGGEPGHVTIQPDFFFNKDLEYLRYGRKVGRPALSISKMKAAYYPDVGLEQLVPDQFWIEAECKYDIAAMYGISHWWFQRQRFYIDRFSSEGDRREILLKMNLPDHSYGGNGDTSFQWSQFTAPCSHLMCSIKDTMTTKRPITQLPLNSAVSKSASISQKSVSMPVEVTTSHEVKYWILNYADGAFIINENLGIHEIVSII